MLNRLYGRQHGVVGSRPRVTQDTDDVHEAETFRTMCLQEISAKIEKINDPLLQDSQIRALNDELNKLMRERRAWEHRVKELGGPDHLRTSAVADGSVTVNNYRYFGRAKQLPEVERLLNSRGKDDAFALGNAKEQFLRLNQTDLEPAYYGYEDENELDLRIPSDDMAQDTQQECALLEFERKRTAELRTSGFEKTAILDTPQLPTEQEYQDAVVALRKQQLLEKLKNR
ncbi:uncharacterized protein OGAPODRAFT_74452 [Ogataea polymorpha]|uniref:Pre-mRNA-splicing factor ISY1 n=1 Tax=Ogataea polymorpha TaxID=460523 RepID=A0A1B7SP04_9ASCO|nr:uncharacterized protein OGAPODRAFT_74452 [Ogataea polymorpha]KAG7930223.1 hypothetical protein KL934_004917 [Ogataea polymorpha]KAH3661023.1 hypothetical protein OGATHE_005355 [Ogataea polymorpha]OBA18197.1 hypothetical protein OGAPODRAFT_74452 [Ogataea polymorpha]